MKKFAILSLLLAVSFSTFAQKKHVETTTKTETITVDYKTAYKARALDNWYLQASFGGTMLMGEDDGSLSFGDRVKPGFSFAVSKQISRVFGVRMSVEGNRLLGWNDNNGGSYVNNTSDPRKEYLDNKGIDTSKGYDQDIKYYSLNADFMVDLINAFSEEKRVFKTWDVEAYMGIGAISTIERKGIDAGTLVAGRIGISTTYNICKRIGINFDINSTITGATFDGHEEESNLDYLCSARIGLKWRIGKQGFKATHVISGEQYALLNNYIAAARTEQMDKAAPEEQVVIVPAKKNNVLMPYIVFHDGKETFNEMFQMANISNIAKMMNENADYKMEIIGNTNSTNAEVAEKRANIIKSILVERYSINADRLTIKTKDMGEEGETVHFINL